MSNIPPYPLGNFQERQRGWLPWKQAVPGTGPFPLNEKLLHRKAPFLSAAASSFPAAAALGEQRALRGDPGQLSRNVTAPPARGSERREQGSLGHGWTRRGAAAAASPSTAARPQGSSEGTAGPEHRELPAPPALAPRTPNPLCRIQKFGFSKHHNFMLG